MDSWVVLAWKPGTGNLRQCVVVPRTKHVMVGLPFGVIFGVVGTDVARSTDMSAAACGLWRLLCFLR